MDPKPVDQSQEFDPYRVGTILMRMAVLTATQLDDALCQKRADENSGQLFLRLKLVSQVDLDAALQAQKLYRAGKHVQAERAIQKYLVGRMSRSLSRTELSLSYLPEMKVVA